MEEKLTMRVLASPQRILKSDPPITTPKAYFSSISYDIVFSLMYLIISLLIRSMNSIMILSRKNNF